MDRRNFLKNSSLLLAAGALVPFAATEVLAQPAPPTTPQNPPTGILNGVIPNGAEAAVSSLFVFHHHHLVFIPQNILDNPPVDGYQTSTSMPMPDLGVNAELIRQSRHYHYHAITFTRQQILSIAAGDNVIVELFLNGALNHRFAFNTRLNSELREIRRIARRGGHATTLPGPVVPRRVG